MAIDPERLLRDALDLTPSQRIELARRLLESLSPDEAESIDDAWRRELSRRMTELDEGKVQPLSWEEAHRRIQGAG